ncbi:MAG: methionine adenosyltransferase [Nanoarchaeota archaeon]|nr:methionine adenosyltransferase [Nanoarchaeota archaeon]
MKRLFTSESVTEGHPDKICDQISDAILDKLIEQDKNSRVAVETLATRGLILIAGEVTTDGYVDVQATARNVVRKVGYTKPEYGFDFDSCAVLVALHEQSPDIARGVVKKRMGAGDQGIMFGYAINETEELMPLPIMLAHKLAMRLAYVRKEEILDWIRPDGKTQVTVEYENEKPKRVHTVVVSTQHSPDVKIKKIREDIKDYVIKPVLEEWIDKKTKYFINPTGRFVIGGPAADTGVTGRKIIVDTYGGFGAHGGGCFSGKDPSKVDRSASYMARYIAKNIVAAELAEKVEVQLAYAIGVSKPVSAMVNTFNTGKLPDDKLTEIINEVFDISPSAIIEHLDLLKPIYEKTAAYGHFGRKEFPWEKTDKVRELKSYI